MGRGRQKAKHTKLARELKYTESQTDLSALQEELAGKKANDIDSYGEQDDYSEIAARYNYDEDEEN
ncbi:MAG: DUF3073 domain-containing protein [Micrococcaceae bacterium]